MNRSINVFRRNHPTLCFWLRREDCQMLNAEQLLYETEKQPPEVFYKDAVLKIFAIFTGNHLREEHLPTAACQLTLWSDCWKFVSGSHLKPSWLSNITKYQSLSNQRFKQILADMPSVYLIPTLSCKPRFYMFIIHGYCKKSKRL